MGEIKPFDERRQQKLNADTQECTNVSTLYDLLRTQFPPTSAERLACIPKENWSADSFRRATNHLCEIVPFKRSLFRSAYRLPKLSAEVDLNRQCYMECRERLLAGENLLIAVVRESRRIIGFGIAQQGKKRATIEIFEVDNFSRRCDGVETYLNLCGEEFSVGLGHVIVASLANAIRTGIEAQPANDSSRYILMSLGFVHLPEDPNDWYLWRPPR